jgi:hypothetical protein
MSFTRDGESDRGPAPLQLVDRPKFVRAVVTDNSDEVPVEERELRSRLAQLRQEHRDLDSSIESLMQGGSPDQLQLTRMKKRKLALRDLIKTIEDELLPDIIA